jgi:Immune inhibitor A peptidase M6
MIRRKRSPALLAVAAITALSLAPVVLSANSPANAAAPTTQASPPSDEQHPRLEVLNGTLPVEGLAAPEPAAATAPTSRAAQAAAVLAEPAVGEVRNWLALDDIAGSYYRKQYTLKAVRPNIEVWVASELNRRAPAFAALPQAGVSSGVAFLDGDCRNGPRTEVTETQAGSLADEFQNNMLPKESAVFSVAPARDGSGTVLPPATYSPAGKGDRTVVLVDNVRDANFYDLNNSKNFTFIAGFFSRQLNSLFDRNVMTIDGWDWIHRTGANPPNDPVPGDSCNSSPARPRGYEGVFAHEYQHLLESYTDPDETTWVNEGLSDWAEVLTGYVTPSTPVTTTGFESHTQCFLGFLNQQTPANPTPRLRGGPENSLTRWSDQDDAEILCDYGATFTFMQYVAGQYGNGFMTSLHNSPGNGFKAVEEALAAVGKSRVKVNDVFNRWTLTVAVDAYIDSGAKIKGPYRKKQLQTDTLNASINWDNPEAYSSPGAPSNGSDYVRLRDSNGAYLTGRGLRSLSFQGSSTLPTKPVAWTVEDFAGRTKVLASGAANDRDESIVKQIVVPAGSPNLTFDAAWNQEELFDYGFVQVSTDGGSSYTSLSCTNTTTEISPDDSSPIAAANLPGFTGDSGGFKPQSCSLASYAGQTVLLSFRGFNDAASLGTNPDVPTGFWVDNVKVGSTAITDGTIAGWRSVTEVKPTSVSGFTVHVISVETRGRDREERRKESKESKDQEDKEDRDKGDRGNGTTVRITKLPLTSDFKIAGDRDLERYVSKRADFVAVVVTYDDPSEVVDQYAPYKLSVNDVVQPGGGM